MYFESKIEASNKSIKRKYYQKLKLNIKNNDKHDASHLEAQNLGTWKNFYFLGIGGIGMSALARYFFKLNKPVFGYDKTSTELTTKLEAEGIKINYNDTVEAIDCSLINPQNTLIVYTPAIPEESLQLKYFKDNKYTKLKRSEALGLLTAHTFCFAVAGTHGKTTTSSILAHLLYECDVPMSAFLGGIAQNYESNFIHRGDEVSVVEADEYDRSFLTLSPDLACITSMDADHLDIYGSKDQLHQSFMEFTDCIKPNGKLFVKNGLPLSGLTYGIDDDSDYAAFDVNIKEGSYLFSLRTPSGSYDGFKLDLPGRHNLSNAVIALAMALSYGCEPSKLAAALSSFKGVERRFNLHIKTQDLVFIDDYAHHPTEIFEVYKAIQEMYPEREALVIFQPHLFSRTQDFIEEFAVELSKFNSIILMDIYPAREKPIKGVSSEWLLGKIQNKNKKIVDRDDLIEEIKKQNKSLVITLGAGDIGAEVPKIKNALLL